LPTVLWRDQVSVPLSAIDFGAEQACIPVSLEVPGDQRPSEVTDLASAHVEWRVIVEADMPGVDYRAVFDVPVLPASVEAEAGPGAFPAPTLAGATPLAADAARPPKRFRLESRPDAAAIQFASPGWFAWWTIGPLLLIPAAAAAARLPIRGDVPAWMVIAGAAAVAAFLLAIALLGVVTTPNRVEVRPDRILVRRGVYGVGWDRAIPISEVTGIVHESMSNGPRVDWNVEIKAGGKSYNAALALHDIDEAKWLAAEIARLVGERSRGLSGRGRE
jgi:membrane protein YdbS with pleckstrin-like domain